MRSLDMNPVYQNLRMALSQADADLAELRGQMAAQQGVVGDLRSRVNSIPEIEAELAAAQSRLRSQQGAVRHAAAAPRVGQDFEQAEQNTENVKFRIIEPPTMPVKPSGPNRPLLTAWCFWRRSRPVSAWRCCWRSCIPTFTTRECCRSSRACRCSARSVRRCWPRSCPGTGGRT